MKDVNQCFGEDVACSNSPGSGSGINRTAPWILKTSQAHPAIAMSTAKEARAIQ